MCPHINESSAVGPVCWEWASIARRRGHFDRNRDGIDKLGLGSGIAILQLPALHCVFEVTLSESPYVTCNNQ